MQFVSLGFVIILPVVALINAFIPREYRYIWLAIASLGFYFALDYKSGIVMAASILLTYGAAVFMGEKGEQARGASQKAAFAISVILSVIMLFVLRSGSILGAIGISFYMLKAVGYLIDVYRGDLKPERNPVKYSLYVSFFPQIICGPIERAGNMLPQFSYPVSVDFYRMRYGLLQILWGFVLKFFIADRLAIFVNNVYAAPGSKAGTIVFIATVFYSFEIYCDFAGYSNIAIGASTLLGIDVMKNFDSPYMSATVAEFWRRWHISLSSWLKDYIYIPLGGNRKGTLRKYINILIVFAVSGIWHGSALTFLIWGLLHAIYEIIGFVMMPVRNFLVDRLKIDRESYSHRAVKIVFTFLLVNAAWVFFRADTVGTALTVLSKSFQFTPWIFSDGSLFKQGLDAMDMNMTVFGLGLMMVIDMINYRGTDLKEKLLHEGVWLRWAVMIFLIMLVLICGIWGPGYDASAFIYQQF